MSFFADLSQAFRALRKNPGFTLVAALTLALGIGMNTAIFSVVNGVLLAPLPYPEPDRIVAVNTRWKDTGRLNPLLAGGDLMDIRAESGLFDAISYAQGGEMGVQLGDRAEFTGIFWVNPEFFRVFRVAPLAGRLFTDADTNEAVINRTFAERHFGDAAGALGRTIRVENRVYGIAGVVAAATAYPRGAEIWVPAPVLPGNRNRTGHNYPTVARLAPGVTREAVQGRLDALGARLEAAFPDSHANKAFAAVPLREQLVESVRDTLLLLMGAVALVLLISCANVANLLLARATGRAREMAVRAALGAGRGRIVRQLVTESVALAVVGGLLGLVLAAGAMDLLVHFAPANLPRAEDIRLDRTVLAFACLVSLVASVLFGLAPAWHTSRTDLSEALKQAAGRGLALGRGRMRNGLVVAEIALSFVLATGAGLLFRSLLALSATDVGYRREGLLIAYAHAPARTLDDHVRVGRFFQDLLPEVAALPGARSAAAAMGLPAGRYRSSGNYSVEGKQQFQSFLKLPQAGFHLASPGYFATMDIPLLRGREFTARDAFDAPLVAIIGDSLARQSFPGEDPIGKRLQCGLDLYSLKGMTVVGVVGDVRQESPASRHAPELYMPLLQHPYMANEVQVVVRTTVDPASLAGAVRQTVARRNPEVALKFTSMDAMVAASFATPRFRTFVLGVFAALALLLATAGVYSVMTYVVAQRTAEMGIRMALGAQPADVLRLVLGRAGLLAAAGLALGLAGSVAAGRVLTGMLFGLKPLDPATYVVVMLLTAAVTVAAAAAPAWRATRIDPVTALRQE